VKSVNWSNGSCSPCTPWLIRRRLLFKTWTVLRAHPPPPPTFLQLLLQTRVSMKGPFQYYLLTAPTNTKIAFLWAATLGYLVAVLRRFGLICWFYSHVDVHTKQVTASSRRQTLVLCTIVTLMVWVISCIYKSGCLRVTRTAVSTPDLLRCVSSSLRPFLQNVWFSSQFCQNSSGNVSFASRRS
jgi:hypothetical protein